jgi:sulfonate transport system substrate-binding protein
MRIGGVPEHYNGPIHKTMERFPQAEWVSHPSGTGAMLEALDKDELDLAVVLMEGAVKHAVCNDSVRLIGTYVDNPLPWGVHVASISSMKELNEDIENLTFGISRFGSGSHLMAIVHANSIGKPVPKFKVVNTMKGARDAMVAGEVDVFLWDITTADVYTKQADWKCIGEISGGWPAFVFVVQRGASGPLLTTVRKFIEALHIECSKMKEQKNSSCRYLCEKYGISEKQASDFLEKINWNSSFCVEDSKIQSVVKALHACNIIPSNNVDRSKIVREDI